MAIYKAWGIQINTTAVTAVISGVTSQQLGVNTTDRQEITAGSHLPRHLSVSGQDPVLRFSTHDVKTAHDAIGTFGILVDAGGDGVNLYEVQIDATGRPTAGATHRKIQIRQGLLYPVRWQVDHRGDLICDYELVVTWDGTNNPITETETVSLPAGLADSIRWSFSKLTFGSTLLADMTSLEITSGIRVDQVSVDSDIWPKHVDLTEATPRVRYTGLNLSQFAAGTVPLVGKVGAHANSTLYFRKRTNALATYVTDITAEHIKCTLEGSMRFEDILNATRADRASASIDIPLLYDGTNDPITFNTASAIT